MSRSDTRKHAVTLLVCISLITGCTSNIPDQIRKPANTTLTPIEVRNQPVAFTGQTVRWGGTIIRTENRQQLTRLIILAKLLNDDGRPQNQDSHLGRFIAQFDHFLEPSVYAAGREVTVYGTLIPSTTEMVDEYPYVYPVIAAQVIHIWPVPSPEPDYWYDPWYPWYPYDPWYPRFPYPPHRPTQKKLPP